MPISLTKPSVGSINWGTNVNTNWTDIENALNGAVYVHDRNEFLGAIGTLISTVSGTAAANSFSATGDPGGHPGIVQHQTGTTTTGRAGIASESNPVTLGNGVTDVEAVVRIPTLSVLAQRFTYRVGLLDSVSAEPTDGVFFRYSDTINGAKWQLVTRSNSVESVADSGTTVAANTWYKLRVSVNAAGTLATFYINGTSVGTIATNIPTTSARATGFGSAVIKSLGTTSRTIDLDYLDFTMLLTTAR